MAGRFVRASKYRHVFGQPTKRENTYDGLRISKNAWDTNLIKANPEYLAVNWEASGGGAFAVIPVSERGRAPDRIPLFRGHTAPVLDTDWNPFDDHLIASGSDDGKVFLWRVPEGFTLHTDAEEPADVSPVGRLSGHSRKVGHVLFNPAAENVLASSSGDYSVKLWDIEHGQSRLALKHADIVQSLSWSADGALLVTTSRDKKMRIWDARQEKAVQENPGHAGAKNSRAVWMGEHDRIATTGFSRMSDRQLGLWDIKSPKEPIGGFQILDSLSSICMPFWDDATNMLFLAGKGDGNIRYYEYENDKFEYLTEYKSGDPQRGIAFVPKRGVNLHENEIMRAYKTVNDTWIEPISFVVPRRAEVFQEDIYPPTNGLKPAVSGKEWFDGKTGLPPKISLEDIYDGKEAVPVKTEYKPREAPASTPAPTKTEPPKPKAEAVPVAEPVAKSPVSQSRPADIKENQQSMSAAANKFAEKDAEDSEDDDDASSFEEIVKPVQRPTVAASQPSPVTKQDPPKPVPAATATATPTTSSSIPSRTMVSSSSSVPQQSSAPAPATTSLHQPASSAGGSAGGAAAGLKDALGDLRDQNSRILGLLEQQARTLDRQSEQISSLTGEVDGLKGGKGGGGGGDGNAELLEKIRRLELELEEARSA